MRARLGTTARESRLRSPAAAGLTGPNDRLFATIMHRATRNPHRAAGDSAACSMLQPTYTTYTSATRPGARPMQWISSGRRIGSWQQRNMQRTTCNSATRNVQRATCNSATRNVQRTTCNSATCNVQRTTCNSATRNVQRTTCNSATCIVQRASCNTQAADLKWPEDRLFASSGMVVHPQL